MRPINFVNPSLSYCSGSLKTMKQPFFCSSFVMSNRVINVFSVIQWTRVFTANSPRPLPFGTRIIITLPSCIHLAKSSSLRGSCANMSYRRSLPKKRFKRCKIGSHLLPNCSLSPHCNNSLARRLLPSFKSSSILSAL
ncbi:unnamed protein product [Bacillus phage SPP1]|uniref:Bacteriophage SPP1 complete nucleotide sequence n=1 Tax=Bacillus phage SPP1 TaxID=10724 RepID=O48487_BPSPP|nr:hypothetical protein SPP1p067 [Bacillus phage SPP1]CAA66534.1 unnamed protein product [Bacillus phage SPP1]